MKKYFVVRKLLVHLFQAKAIRFLLNCENMKVNYMKTRFNNEVLHVAFYEDNLTFIRCTNANSGKEVVLDDYDTQIMNERIVDYISDLQDFN